MLEFFKCKTKDCTNRVHKKGDLCEVCKLRLLEKKPHTVDEAFHPYKKGKK